MDIPSHARPHDFQSSLCAPFGPWARPERGLLSFVRESSLLNSRTVTMKEILPGVFHWKTFHEGIQAYVHSYYINATDPAVLTDPRVPAQGIEWSAAHGAPRHVYLTNRHHYRHSDRFAGRYGAQVWCHKDGLHEFSHGEKVRGFGHGRGMPGGILAVEGAARSP